MLNNPFLVNMYYAFQDRENLYLVMDLLSGGDLRYHICRNRRFTEEQTSNSIPLIIGFFIACLVAGLEFIHNKKIIHRDIKPENLVLDDEGKKVFHSHPIFFNNVRCRVSENHRLWYCSYLET